LLHLSFPSNAVAAIAQAVLSSAAQRASNLAFQKETLNVAINNALTRIDQRKAHAKLAGPEVTEFALEKLARDVRS
jgi:hypothetical protein